MNTKELIKQLKLEKNTDYIIFISTKSGLSKEDLYSINLKGIETGKVMIALVKGNVAKLIKMIKIDK